LYAKKEGGTIILIILLAHYIPKLMTCTCT